MEIINSFIDPIVKFLPKLPLAILEIIVGIIVIKIVLFTIRRALKVFKCPADLRGVIISISKVALWVMLIIFIASSLGFNRFALALSGSAVVLVFILNTGAGPLISDLISGFFLIGDPDFTVGMRVISNDGKTEGVIHGIDMRKVRIKDDEGKMHVIPNNLVDKGEWIVVERRAKAKKIEKIKEKISDLKNK